MSEVPAGSKRPLDPNTEDDTESAEQSSKRRKSVSVSKENAPPEQGYSSDFPPPSSRDLDRLNYHVQLQDFGIELQKAASAIFPSRQTSRYMKVEVLLLSWEDEDPNLPVSLEIAELTALLKWLYAFEVEEWLIPGENSHNRLQSKILDFLGDSDPKHLKIVYYAGHGKLTNHGQPAWTSRRNSGKERCPTVKWSGIQNSLEESGSDVLILLDCCASGVCTTDEGNGVTELIAACAYNAIANGVGPFSFTHALVGKLRLLAQLPIFPVGHLYNAVFTEVQGWRFEDARHKKAPIHLVLSQNLNRPRSIQISKCTEEAQSIAEPLRSLPLESQPPTTESTPPPHHLTPSDSYDPRSTSSLSAHPSPSTSLTSLSQVPIYPRILLSIRLNEDIKAEELSSGLFADWLRSVPVTANLVRVEAGFASDSTLVMVSVPVSMVAYLRFNPAVMVLGTVRSSNLVSKKRELKDSSKSNLYVYGIKSLSFVKNNNLEELEAIITSTFKKYGTVEKVQIMMDEEKFLLGEFYVKMATTEAAQKAMEGLNYKMLGKYSYMKIRLAKSEQPPESNIETYGRVPKKVEKDPSPASESEDDPAGIFLPTPATSGHLIEPRSMGKRRKQHDSNLNKTCQNCRESAIRLNVRVRCNGKTPCGRCSTRGEKKLCIYDKKPSSPRRLKREAISNEEEKYSSTSFSILSSDSDSVFDSDRSEKSKTMKAEASAPKPDEEDPVITRVNTRPKQKGITYIELSD